MEFPESNDTVVSERFRGLPQISPEKCDKECSQCISSCPTDAIGKSNNILNLDLGRCLFCLECLESCPEGAIEFTRNYKLSTTNRKDLVFSTSLAPKVVALNKKINKLFGRSLKLRQVSAAGCNGCEVELGALNTNVWDLSRFGISFVASPRHADGLLITGPVSRNMKQALEKTYSAMAEPKIVIAVGACAISGGPYINHSEVHNGVTDILPVDLFIPGCPSHPATILDGLLQLLDKKLNLEKFQG